LEQHITTPTQTRWLPKFLGYDYQIEYKRGLENQGADSLSRVVKFQFISLSLPSANWWSLLQKEIQQDSFYGDLLTKGSTPLLQRDGLWFKNDKVFLNPTSQFIQKILNYGHSSPISGHYSYHKTLTRIKQNFIWSGMRGMVKEFLRECDVCQRFKSDCMKPVGLLQPLSIPTTIWTNVSMDFIEGLPTSNGYTVIMVIVDRLMKYAHFAALKHQFTSAIVAKVFIANVVRLHRIPASIVTDRDRVFLSSFWQALFQLQGTQLCMSSSYHPQSDDQTKVMNRTLEQYLCCFAGDQPKKWVEWLPWAEFSYNTSLHLSTKTTPFEAVYGTLPSTLLTYVPGTSRIQAVDESLRDRDAILKELRHNLSLAQNRMKCQAGQHRRDVSFEVGDHVYLKLQPYRQSSVAFRASMKLSARFFGPYQIVGKVSQVAYKLLLPPGSLIHDVFHDSLLRKHHGQVTQPPPHLPLVSDSSTIFPEPEAILDRRIIRKGQYRPKSKILVKCKGALVEDAT
jgi:hypothetical protein